VAGPSVDPASVGPDFEDLRWFWLPEEVVLEAGGPSGGEPSRARG
jgi:hypothetical protein